MAVLGRSESNCANKGSGYAKDASSSDRNNCAIRTHYIFLPLLLKPNLIHSPVFLQDSREVRKATVTSNLPFDEWTSVFGSERLTGALLDRLTHHVHILEMNGDSYRLNQSKHRSRRPSSDRPADNPTQA